MPHIQIQKRRKMELGNEKVFVLSVMNAFLAVGLVVQILLFFIFHLWKWKEFGGEMSRKAYTAILTFSIIQELSFVHNQKELGKKNQI